MMASRQGPSASDWPVPLRQNRPVKVLSSGLRLRYRYPGILLRAMVITDFGVRYQVSLLGCLLTLVRTLALFTILHIIFMQLLKIGAGVPQMIDSPRPDPHAQ